MPDLDVMHPKRRPRTRPVGPAVPCPYPSLPGLDSADRGAVAFEVRAASSSEPVFSR